MPRRKGDRDIAPQIRGAFMRAMKIMEEDQGKPLSTMITDAIEEHGILKVLDTMAKFNPKEVNATVEERSVTDFVLDKLNQRSDGHSNETQH